LTAGSGLVSSIRLSSGSSLLLSFLSLSLPLSPVFN
jgi:hypothetical protein